MPAVAARAGLATSTAWRHFSSIEKLTSAYTLQQLHDLTECCEDFGPGSSRFDQTLDTWVEIVLRNGPAMVQFRSKKGYLERLHEGDEVIAAARQAWEPAVTGLIAGMGLVGSLVEEALFLANSLLDPREILDLHNYAHMGRSEIVRKLSNAFRGALRGWVAPEGVDTKKMS